MLQWSCLFWSEIIRTMLWVRSKCHRSLRVASGERCCKSQNHFLISEKSKDSHRNLWYCGKHTLRFIRLGFLCSLKRGEREKERTWSWSVRGSAKRHRPRPTEGNVAAEMSLSLKDAEEVRAHVVYRWIERKRGSITGRVIFGPLSWLILIR